MLADVVACPGADSCKLAITSSNQAGYSMREEMIKFDYQDPEVRKVSVKISGCPNGCGQHHLAGIGLQGSSYKVGKLEVPCYDIFVGGGGYQGVNATPRASPASRRRRPTSPSTRSSRSTRQSAPADRRASTTTSTASARSASSSRSRSSSGSARSPRSRRCTWTGATTDLFEVIRGEGECAAGDMPVVRVAAGPVDLA